MAELSSPVSKPSVDQIGIVVRDLHGMIAVLKQLFGIDDFRIMEWPIDGIDPEATYHGKPGNYRLLLGFASVGTTQLEIIQPLEGKNIYSDFLAEHGPGLHHFRLTVTDFDEQVDHLQAHGIENIASGTGVHLGSRWAYFDTSSILEGVIVEIRKRLGGADGQGQWIDHSKG